MAEPITYEQIVQELRAKRELKPWEMMAPPQQMQAPPGPSGPAPGGPTTDPMSLAQQRAGINQALAPMGDVANPETMAARQGRPNAGLIQMLLNLMAR